MAEQCLMIETEKWSKVQQFRLLRCHCQPQPQFSAKK